MVSINDKLILQNTNFENKTTLVRVDWNVPIKDAKIADPFRIISSFPTISHLIEKGCSKILLISHLGRPKPFMSSSEPSNPNNDIPEVNKPFSFLPLKNQIEVLLTSHKLHFSFHISSFNLSLEDVESTKKHISSFPKESIILFENIRIHTNETKPPKTGVSKLSKNLEASADIFVLDAFACAHRAHTSISHINLPIRCAGLLVQKEFEHLERFLSSSLSLNLETNKENGGDGRAVILGGAKVSDKVRLIKNLVKGTKLFIIGGAMANTFLYHFPAYYDIFNERNNNDTINNKEERKEEMGKSLLERGEDVGKLVREIIEEAKKFDTKIILPIDFILDDGTEFCFSSFNNNIKKNEENNSVMGKERKILDIGPKSISLFCKELENFQKVFWNGPLGFFEDKRFRKGTFEVLEFLCKRSKENGTEVLIGGGDTAAAVNEMKGKDGLGKGIYVSTGGGASIEVLEGKTLPGLSSLSDRV